MFVCALLAFAGKAAAFDAVSLTLGHALGVTSFRGALVWVPRCEEFLPRWLQWTGADPRFELAASVWHGRAGGSTQGTLLGVDAMPLLRWTFAGAAASQPFIDFGVGPRLWTGTSIGPGHRFGTAFEFGTVLGAGLRQGNYDVFVRLEHTSNVGIKQPNSGLNFVQVGVSTSLGN